MNQRFERRVKIVTTLGPATSGKERLRELILAGADMVRVNAAHGSDDERKRLRQILDRIRPAEHGLIVRTAAENVTADEIERDVARLVKQWEQISELASKQQRPGLIYREPEMAVRIIREEFNAEYRGVLIDDKALYEDMRDYVAAVAPALVDRIEYFDPAAESLPMFERYHVSEQLVKALDRFDPERGVAFSTFAGRTIEGALKRHFRDQTWSLRVPRSVKDLHVAVRRASEEMEQQLARSPTVRELADHLGVSVDEVVGAIGAVSARRAGSLDRPDGESPNDHEAALGRPGGTGDVEDRDQVERLLATLEPREQEIIRLRFYEQLSQEQIAARVGLSQMHVSRLLRQSFAQMRSAESD